VAVGEAAPLEETTRLPETKPTPLPPTVAIKEQKRRNVVVEAVVIGAFMIVAIVVLVLALSNHTNDPDRPLSNSHVAHVARSFARAYSREDSRALSRLLSPDVQRISASDVQRGRSSVVGAYRSQFRSQVTRAYKLD